MPELILYERVNNIAKITMNRPEKLNALNIEMSLLLREALERFDRDDDARVAILHGTGRAFCTGTDVRERQTGDRHNLPPGMDGAHSSADYLTRFENWKPVIAAVHGYAVGGGLSLCMNCDMIVADETATFQITETPRGTSPAGLWAALKERTGVTFADDVSLTGRFWNAEEALQWRMINCVVPEADLMNKAMEVAESIAANPPLPVQDVVRRRRYRNEMIRLEIKASATRNFRATADFEESAKAFVEKRKPATFSGS